jgi:hypothetical protein
MSSRWQHLQEGGSHGDSGVMLVHVQQQLTLVGSNQDATRTLIPSEEWGQHLEWPNPPTKLHLLKVLPPPNTTLGVGGKLPTRAFKRCTHSNHIQTIAHSLFQLCVCLRLWLIASWVCVLLSQVLNNHWCLDYLELGLKTQSEVLCLLSIFSLTSLINIQTSAK